MSYQSVEEERNRGRIAAANINAAAGISQAEIGAQSRYETADVGRDTATQVANIQSAGRVQEAGVPRTVNSNSNVTRTENPIFIPDQNQDEEVPGLATGGPAKGSLPYIVGEKGPELFVPKTDGTVIPNHSLQTLAVPRANGGDVYAGGAPGVGPDGQTRGRYYAPEAFKALQEQHTQKMATERQRMQDESHLAATKIAGEPANAQVKLLQDQANATRTRAQDGQYAKTMAEIKADWPAMVAKAEKESGTPWSGAQRQAALNSTPEQQVAFHARNQTPDFHALMSLGAPAEGEPSRPGQLVAHGYKQDAQTGGWYKRETGPDGSSQLVTLTPSAQGLTRQATNYLSPEQTAAGIQPNVNINEANQQAVTEQKAAAGVPAPLNAPGTEPPPPATAFNPPPPAGSLANATQQTGAEAAGYVGGTTLTAPAAPTTAPVAPTLSPEASFVGGGAGRLQNIPGTMGGEAAFPNPSATPAPASPTTPTGLPSLAGSMPKQPASTGTFTSNPMATAYAPNLAGPAPAPEAAPAYVKPQSLGGLIGGAINGTLQPGGYY